MIRKPCDVISGPYQKSLHASWKEGVAAVVMLTVIDYYLIPLGLFLGATSFQIGLLVALPQLLGSLTQLFAVKIVRFVGSRLSFLVLATRIQVWILAGIAFLPLFAFVSSVPCFILLVVLFRITGNLTATVWGSLISDYLSAEERGRYLGWRTQVTTLAGIGAMLLAGLLLSAFKSFSQGIGFALLFLGITVARLISSCLMARMEEVPIQYHKGDDFSFIQFLVRFRESNFVRFVLYVASITFATHLAAPYFSVYMLKELNLDYFLYTLLHLTSVVGGIIAYPLWGRHADVVGNAKVLKATSFLVPLLPFGWIFSKNIFYLCFLEFAAGFVWAGFNLCSVNFIFDAVAPGKRVRCLSYFGLINGAALFVGATLGGACLDHVPALFGSRFYTLFALSAFFRMLSHFFLSHRFREVREQTRKVSSKELFFSVIGIRPFSGRDKQLLSEFPNGITKEGK